MIGVKMLGLIRFFTGLFPKTWLTLFAILSLIGAFFWFRYSIYVDCQTTEQAKQEAAKVEGLEQALEEAKQYNAFLLANQRKNEDFIKRQKRALKDANEQDGDVAPILRGTLERLRNDRTD